MSEQTRGQKVDSTNATMMSTHEPRMGSTLPPQRLMTRSPGRPSKLRLLHEVKVQLQETLTVYCHWASLARHSSKLQPFHSLDERLSPSVVLSGHNSQQMCNASGGIIRLGHRLSCLPFGKCYSIRVRPRSALCSSAHGRTEVLETEELMMEKRSSMGWCADAVGINTI